MFRTLGDVTFCIRREHSQPLSRWWERGCGAKDAVAKADPLILIVFRSSLCVLSLGRGERNKRSDIIENPGDYRHLSHQGPRFSITSENFLSDLLLEFNGLLLVGNFSGQQVNCRVQVRGLS